MKITSLFTCGLVLLSGAQAAPDPDIGELPAATFSKPVSIDDILDKVRSDPATPYDKDQWERARVEADMKAQRVYETGIATLYVQQVKKALIDPKNHGGWPVRTFLLVGRYPRKVVFDALQTELAEHPSPLIKYALICPALYNQEDAVVEKLLAELKEEDAFLHERAMSQIDTYWRPYITRALGNAQ